MDLVLHTEETCYKCGKTMHSIGDMIYLRSCPQCGFFFKSTYKTNNNCKRCGGIFDRRELLKPYKGDLIQCSTCRHWKVMGDTATDPEMMYVSMDDRDYEYKLFVLACAIRKNADMMNSYDNDIRWQGMHML